MGDFKKDISGSICYFQCGSKFLMVKRSAYKSHGANHWGAAGGTTDEGESERETLDREILEELGVDLRGKKEVKHVEDLFIRNGTHGDYTLHIFHMLAENEFDVTLSSEHSEFSWMTWEQIQSVDLMGREVNEVVMRKLTPK